MRKYTKWIGLATVILGMPWSLAAADGRATTDLQSRRSVERMDFGKTPDGTPVELYVLTNGKITAKVMTYGAISPSSTCRIAGEDGDVVLGFDSLDAYLAGHPHFGATTGRVANRIAKGRFTLDGQEYKLAVNNGPNTLHGGLKGFDKVVWKAEDVSGPAGPAVKLTYLSPDGEEGYPGEPFDERDLHGHRRRCPQDRLHGHDRQGDAGQPHQPQLLQPGRSRLGDDPGPRADCWRPTSTRPRTRP